jgi:hypothetical protein
MSVFLKVFDPGIHAICPPRRSGGSSDGHSNQQRTHVHEQLSEEIPMPSPTNGHAQANLADDPVLSIFGDYNVQPSDADQFDPVANMPPNPASNAFSPSAPNPARNAFSPSALNPASNARVFTPPSAGPPSVPRVALNGAPPTNVVVSGPKSGMLTHDYNAQVIYVHNVTTRRQKYQVTTIGGLMYRAKGHRKDNPAQCTSQILFDTATIRKYFSQKVKKEEYGLANAGLAKKDGSTIPVPEEWDRASLIWVCANEITSDLPVFYSHVCKMGRFHHTSVVAGGDVVGAGEWIVRNGKLWKISANSGHYRLSIDFLHRSVLFLGDAVQSDTTVFLYDSQTDSWIDRPAAEFKKNPSGGGRYFAHPAGMLRQP